MSTKNASRDDEQGKDRDIADNHQQGFFSLHVGDSDAYEADHRRGVYWESEACFLFQFNRKLRDGRSSREFPKIRYRKVEHFLF